MRQYRTKPQVLDAFQLTRESRTSNSEWPEWMHAAWNKERGDIGSVSPALRGDSYGPLMVYGCLTADDKRAAEHVDFEDWIVRFDDGELDVYSDDPFHYYFEPTT